MTRGIKAAAALAGTCVVFTAAAAGGLLLHIDSPAARRIVVSRGAALLGPTFRGAIVIERLDHIGLDGVGGLRVRILDGDGLQVVFADGVEARLTALDVVRSAVLGGGALSVHLAEVSIAYADVSLDADESGTLRLARAFEPREPASSPEEPSRGVDLSLESVRVAHAWVHGRMPGAPLVDCDVDGAQASIHVTPEQTVVDLSQARITTRAMPQGADLAGEVSARLALPSDSGGSLGLRGHFRGEIGRVPAEATATLDGDRVEAVADVPRVAAEKLRALFPGAPLHDDVELHAEARGTLADLAIQARAGVGAGRVAVDGRVALGDETRAQATIEARAIDLRAFAPDAPASDLAATARVALVARPDGGLLGTVALEVERGVIAGNVVPHATLRADVTERSVRGTGTIDEAGAPSRVAFHLHPEEVAPERGFVVDFDVRSTVPDLAGVRRVGPIARGSARLEVEGRLGLTRMDVDARARVSLASLSRSGVRLGRGTIDARIRGTLDDPFVNASLRGERLEAMGYAWKDVRAGVRGKVGAPLVTAALTGAEGTPDIEAQAALELGPRTTARSASVAVTREGVRAVARAGIVQIEGAEVRAGGVLVEGLGEPVHASMRLGPASLSIQAASRGIEIDRVARLLGLAPQRRSEGSAIRAIVASEPVKPVEPVEDATGTLAFDVSLAVRGPRVEGRIEADLEHGRVPGLPSADLHAVATLDDRKLSSRVRADLGDTGHLALSADVELGGAPLQARSWTAASGEVDLDSSMDLARLRAILPPDVLPLGELTGELRVHASAARSEHMEIPDLALSVETIGLAMAGPSEALPDVAGTRVQTAPPWRSTGVDVALSASVRGADGHTDVQGRATDARGPLSAFTLSAVLPYGELARDRASALARLATTPFEATIAVPRRELGSFPLPVRTLATAGPIELEARAHGTLREPRIEAHARAERLNVAGSPLSVGTDVDLDLRYDGRAADVSLQARTKGGGAVDATSHVEVAIADVLHAAPGHDVPWRASARAEMTRFPLESLSPLADRRVRGSLSGVVEVADLHADARARADLRLADLRIGRARFTAGHLAATLDGRGLDATVRLDQKDGFAQAEAKLGTRWGEALAPSLDEAQPLAIALRASRFRAAAFLPFLQGSVGELDGRIDADARVDIGARGERIAMKGTVKLREGLVELPSVGEELHAVQLDVTLDPSGTIRIERGSAEGVTGLVQVAASARMDGFRFVGARAAIRIPEGDPLPLAIEGETLGEAWGAVDVTAAMARDGKALDVEASVPRLVLRVPDTSRHDVQKLEPAEHVRIGVHREPGVLTLLPLSAPEPESTGETATAVHVSVVLTDAEVRRGSDVRVRLEGRPEVHVAEQTRVTGQIRLRDGFVEIQGKRFEIERGTVTFVGPDPANPDVVVTAGWTAPDGTRVYADYVGPLETGKVTLRSEPARSSSEILSLLLFGTPEGLNAPPRPGPGPDGTTRAVGMGGGLATQGLNQALEDLTNLGISTRVDTTDSANPRPEIEVEIAKGISLRVAHVLGVPPPGTSPDKNLATIDWRFARGWSVETTLGDRGSAIFDFIWVHRY